MRRLFILPFLFLLSNTTSKAYHLNYNFHSQVIKLDTGIDSLISIHIDLSNEKQTIENFGASDCWTTKFVGKWKNDQKKNLIADYLFSTDTFKNGQPKGIGLSLWRFNIGSGSFEQGVSSNIKDEYRREECFLDANGKYDWTKQAGQQWFLDAAKERGLNNFLAFSLTPPVQFTIDNRAHGLGGANLNLKAGKENEFADFLVNVVKHFNKEGYNMPYLSPFNEPQWNWGEKNTTQEGTAATNKEIVDFVKILGPKLNNTSVKIALGEAAQWNFLSNSYDSGRGNQIKDFFSPNSENYIGNVPNVENLLSAHSYFTTCPNTSLIKYRVGAMLAKQKFAPNLRLWQTEFGILGDICGKYSGAPRNTSIDYGLYVAKVIHHDLTIANVSAWHWWLAVSPYNYSDALVYINDLGGGFDLNSIKTEGQVSDSKQLWCLGNYSRFVRPGMIRVDAALRTIEDDNISASTQMVSAYKNPITKKVVIVIINMDNRSNKFVLDNASVNLANNKSAMYTTNDLNNLAKSTVDVRNIIIPGKSVVTLVVDYKE